LNLALAYYKQGQISEASIELATLHREQPAERQVLLLLADCRLRQGNNTAVVELLSGLEKKNPDDLAIAYLLGTALLRDKQIERGQLIIDRILRNGDSAESRLLLGTAKMTAEEFEAAIPDLQRAAELNPKLPEVHSYLGNAYVQTGDTASARSAFQKELELNPNDFASNLQLAALLRLDHDYPAALDLLNRALRVRPGDLRAEYQLASVELAAGNLDSARARLESILKRAPGFVEAHISLATVYYRLKRKPDGDHEKALAQKLSEEKRAGKVLEKTLQPIDGLPPDAHFEVMALHCF
jgi:tetratricopeptide (TPR) repeat protein